MAETTDSKEGGSQDHLIQDYRFQEAMKRELARGTENCLTGVIKEPGTSREYIRTTRVYSTPFRSSALGDVQGCD